MVTIFLFRISDVDAWVKVEAITTPSRSNVCMLQIDHQNHVSFPILDFGSKEYAVYMRAYLFELQFEYTMFWTEIRTNTVAITNDFATWCVTVKQDSTTFTATSQLFDGAYKEEHAVSFTHVKSGWQYLRFIIENNGANLYHNFYVGKIDKNDVLLYHANLIIETSDKLLYNFICFYCLSINFKMDMFI